MYREIESEIALILTELPQDKQQKVEQYIESLFGEISDLEGDIEDLEDKQRECEFCESNYKGMNHPIAQIVREIVDDQYYTTKTYQTKEDIVEKLEHALRYDCVK